MWLALFVLALVGGAPVEISRGPGDAAGGFVEMVPPARLPTSVDGGDRIEVWLRIPPRGRVGAHRAGGRWSLDYPPGTVAERREWLRERLIDVRGVRLGEPGRDRFFVEHAITDGRLEGYEWTRARLDDERAVAAQLAERLRAAGSAAPLVERVRRLGACSGCHERDRAERRDAAALGPRRATDGAGLFQVETVLADEVPIEAHRPRDLNATDRFVRVQCGASAAEPTSDANGARGWRCADGGVPIARFDLRAALAGGDPRAESLCRARRYLYDHMSSVARAAFANAFRACRSAEW
ncbi:MAG TPA: hypothetical protein VFF06_10610 [Polyangia bacterium]|nr:hypothetical protein [Polyangia bacterium]